jgi:hypothetical protein
MTVNGRSSVLFEQLTQSQLVDDFRFFFNLDFHYCIQNSQSLVHILIKMKPVNTLLFRFKIHSNMILPSTHRASNFPFIMLLFTPSEQYLESATTLSFPILSYCIRFVASCRHCKTNIHYAEVLHKHVLSLCSDFKCFVCCCYVYTVHSFFSSAVPKCVLGNFNNISLSVNSKTV